LDREERGSLGWRAGGDAEDLGGDGEGVVGRIVWSLRVAVNMT
jgi:hypothetical protein